MTAAEPTAGTCLVLNARGVAQGLHQPPTGHCKRTAWKALYRCMLADIKGECHVGHGWAIALNVRVAAPKIR